MKRRSIVPQKKQSGLCFFRFEAGALSSRIETRAGACRGSAALTANRDLRFDLTLMRARRRVSARSRWERLSSKRRQAGFWTACAAARAVKKGRCGRSYPPAGVLGDPLLSLMSSCFPANRRSDVRRRSPMGLFDSLCSRFCFSRRANALLQVRRNANLRSQSRAIRPSRSTNAAYTRAASLNEDGKAVALAF